MPSSSTLSFKTRFALATAIILWASAFVGIRIGLHGYSPGALALLRFLIASVCMVFVSWPVPQLVKVKRLDLFLLILVGAIGLGCYHVALNYGELTVPSGIASFIISQSPLLTMVLAVIFLHEKFNAFALLGVIVSILGVGLIALGESHDIQFQIGMLYVLVAAFMGGFYSVMQKPFLKKYHAVHVTAYIIWGATLSLCIYFPSLFREIQQAPLSATLAVIYLGIFPAAVAYVAWSYALASVTASKVSSFLYFMPIIATLLGWVCLGEVPAFLSLVGGLVALLGVWIANSR